jgi:hypothetical protein
VPGRKPGPPLEDEHLVINLRFARPEEPSGWRLLLQVRAVIFRFAPGTHSN